MFMHHDCYLPGLRRYMFSPKTSFHRVATFTLKEGLELIKTAKQKHMFGVDVEGISNTQSTRIRMFADGQTKCVSCGIEGSYFYIERHKNDRTSLYSLNLYGQDGHSERMLTWDHIIPRSYGGSNYLINAQCMCSVCNHAKGNTLTISELVSIGSRADALEMYAKPQPNNSTIKDTVKVVQTEFDKLVGFNYLSMEKKK